MSQPVVWICHLFRLSLIPVSKRSVTLAAIWKNSLKNIKNHINSTEIAWILILLFTKSLIFKDRENGFHLFHFGLLIYFQQGCLFWTSLFLYGRKIFAIVLCYGDVVVVVVVVVVVCRHFGFRAITWVNIDRLFWNLDMMFVTNKGRLVLHLGFVAPTVLEKRAKRG